MEDITALKKNWGWLLVLGIILVFLGILALSASFFVTLISVIFFACLLIISGVAQLSYLFFVKDGHKSVFLLVTGLLSAVVGLLLLFHPASSAVVVTFLLAVFFVVSGALRLITALISHEKHMFWSMLYGIVVFLLGIIVLADMPMAGLVFIGLLIGIEFILNGIGWIAVAIVAKASK
ncbi:MAG: HdeD family acid-resistance protein [Candidatus Staskawiczbacteria bacterium]|nr:HdeD family acid-resistance protein [Candidatus Staskawiczbacteria bacterium]